MQNNVIVIIIIDFNTKIVLSKVFRENEKEREEGGGIQRKENKNKIAKLTEDTNMTTTCCVNLHVDFFKGVFLFRTAIMKSFNINP